MLHNDLVHGGDNIRLAHQNKYSSPRHVDKSRFALLSSYYLVPAWEQAASEKMTAARLSKTRGLDEREGKSLGAQR